MQDVRGRSPAEVGGDLRAWFPQEDPITDFNAFFQRAALHVRRNNLILAPLNVVLFSDGEPDYSGAGRLTADERYKRVDLSRSEEHTSELQSRPHLVCRLLLEKKNHPSGASVV